MKEFLQSAFLQSTAYLQEEEIIEINTLSKLSTHQTWKVQCKSGKSFFAKTASCQESERITFEADGLNNLSLFASEEKLIIPKPLTIYNNPNNSALILPWIEMKSGDQGILGCGLASLHESSSKDNPGRFGWTNQGFIGSGQQKGGWREKWGECFIELRLIPQINKAKKWGLYIENQEQLLSYLTRILNLHNPIPTLVHGDLWSGNIGLNNQNKGVLFDPAVWWADREVDIAMTKLFGGFSNNFYKAYKKTWSLPENNEKRVNIYNLYHILNHANIFGGHYKTEVLTSLKIIKESMNEY